VEIFFHTLYSEVDMYLICVTRLDSIRGSYEKMQCSENSW